MEHFLTHEGYLALALLALIQACCIPIPSEITLGFAGVLAGEGKLNLAIVIVVATIAEVVGSYVAYTIGRVGGRPLVERLGRYVLIGPSDLDRAERWLAGRGEFAVAIGRALPVLRAFASVIAGIAEMPPLRFGIASVGGTLVFASALSSIGFAVGSAWQRVAHDFSLAGYVVAAAVVAAAAVFVLHRVRSARPMAEPALLVEDE